MGKVKKTRKFAAVRRMLNPNDERIKAKEEEKKQQTLARELREKNKQTTTLDGELIRHAPKISSAMFLSYNTALGPPYHILCDTNFINFSLTNKLDIIRSMMDCLLAKCIPCVTDCVIAEFEKLGSKYRVALAMAKDPRFTRLKCDHKGTYADDCLVKKVMQHKCYIVATCDKDLKRRIRKVPGIPIMFIKSHRYSIERFPTINNAPKHS